MELATLHLDTYKIVKLLQEKGYTEAQAEGFMQAIQEITLSGVATKQDIADVREEIKDVEGRMLEKMAKGFSDSLKFQLIQTVALMAVMIALSQIFG